MKKKIELFIFILIGLFIFTGCGNKDVFSSKSTIVCTKSEKDASSSNKSTLTFTYNKKEIVEDFKVETEIVYNNPMPKQALELIESGMKLVGKSAGVNFKSKVTEKSIYYSFHGNIKKFAKLLDEGGAKVDYNLVESDSKKANVLEEAKNDGYTCVDNPK